MGWSVHLNQTLAITLNRNKLSVLINSSLRPQWLCVPMRWTMCVMSSRSLITSTYLRPPFSEFPENRKSVCTISCRLWECNAESNGLGIFSLFPISKNCRQFSGIFFVSFLISLHLYSSSMVFLGAFIPLCHMLHNIPAPLSPAWVSFAHLRIQVVLNLDFTLSGFATALLGHSPFLYWLVVLTFNPSFPDEVLALEKALECYYGQPYDYQRLWTTLSEGQRNDLVPLIGPIGTSNLEKCMTHGWAYSKTKRGSLVSTQKEQKDTTHFSCL